MTADTDLHALLTRLTPLSRPALAGPGVDSERPQRTIVPLADYIGRGLVRFACPLGLPADVRSYGPGFAGMVRGPAPCGWAYDHDSFADDAEPISVPVSASPEEVSRLLSARAERRSEELRRRIEGELREHFTVAHPGIEPPERELP
ncbi:hypothetical protein GCM10010250_22470 [Streptomyces althioticus]|uniref:hypothetical protein n=1 Tax=Streptomyces althioticus TaxID=83380 RepID=UPI0018769175|nr:hypothetical protein GCM10010250_22470 [Streptomyces althioticus]